LVVNRADKAGDQRGSFAPQSEIVDLELLELPRVSFDLRNALRFVVDLAVWADALKIVSERSFQKRRVASNMCVEGLAQQRQHDGLFIPRVLAEQRSDLDRVIQKFPW